MNEREGAEASGAAAGMKSEEAAAALPMPGAAYAANTPGLCEGNIGAICCGGCA
jgi:hypothetical protein